MRGLALSQKIKTKEKDRENSEETEVKMLNL